MNNIASSFENEQNPNEDKDFFLWYKKGSGKFSEKEITFLNIIFESIQRLKKDDKENHNDTIKGLIRILVDFLDNDNKKIAEKNSRISNLLDSGFFKHSRFNNDSSIKKNMWDIFLKASDIVADDNNEYVIECIKKINEEDTNFIKDKLYLILYRIAELSDVDTIDTFLAYKNIIDSNSDEPEIIKNKCIDNLLRQKPGCLDLSLRMHLFDYPLYECINSNSEELKVLVLGFGNYSQAFLDLCLEYAQNLSYSLKVDVYAKDINENYNSYLHFRKALKNDNSNKFFSIKEPNKKTTFTDLRLISEQSDSDSYGEINFQSFDIKDDYEIDWCNEIPALIDYNYIYISTGENKRNRGVLDKVVHILDLSSKEHKVSINCVDDSFSSMYNSDYSKDIDDHANNIKIHYFNPNYNCLWDDIDSKLQSLAFNVHLSWCGGVRVNFKEEMEKFRDNYNDVSSLSCLLSIKYKIWNIWPKLFELVNAWQETVENTSEYNSKKIPNNQKAILEQDFETVWKTCLETKNFSLIAFCVNLLFDSKDEERYKIIFNQMMWQEHKRWVVEKICNGWTKLDESKCIALRDDKNKLTKEHVCLVKSSQKPPVLSEIFNSVVDWDDYDTEEDDKDLDELDFVSLNVHLQYKKYVNDVNHTNTCYRKLDDINSSINNTFLANPKLYDIYNIFKMWRASALEIIDLRNKDKLVLKRYNDLIKKLKSIINKCPEINNEGKLFTLITNIDQFDKEYLYYFKEYKKCVDYKSIDNRLILQIPFILTYDSDAEVVIKFNNDDLIKNVKNRKCNVEKVYKILIPVLLYHPRKCYYEYDGCLPSRIDDFLITISNVLSYKKNFNIETEIFIYLPNGNINAFENFIKNDDSIKNQELDYKKIKEYLKFEEPPLNLIEIKKYEDNSQMLIDNISDCYKYKYVNIDKKSRIEEVLCLMGSKTTTDLMPFYYDEYSNIWELYCMDKKSWKDLAKIVKNDDSFARKIGVINRIDNEGKDFNIILDRASINGATYILSKLKGLHYISEDSSIDICTDKWSFDTIKINIRKPFVQSEDIEKLFQYSSSEHLLDDFSKILVLPEDRYMSGDKLSNEYDKVDWHDKIGFYYNNLKISKIKSIINEINQKSKTNGISYTNIYKLLSELEQNKIVSSVSNDSFNFPFSYYKKMFSNEGQIFEIYTYQKLKESGKFDDVLSSYQIKWNNEEKGAHNEFDCIVVKDFVNCFIECKAWENPFAFDLNNKEFLFNEACKKIIDTTCSLSPNRNVVLFVDTDDKRFNDLCGKYDCDCKFGTYNSICSLYVISTCLDGCLDNLENWIENILLGSSCFAPQSDSYQDKFKKVYRKYIRSEENRKKCNKEFNLYFNNNKNELIKKFLDDAYLAWINENKDFSLEDLGFKDDDNILEVLINNNYPDIQDLKLYCGNQLQIKQNNYSAKNNSEKITNTDDDETVDDDIEHFKLENIKKMANDFKKIF